MLHFGHFFIDGRLRYLAVPESANDDTLVFVFPVPAPLGDDRSPGERRRRRARKEGR